MDNKVYNIFWTSGWDSTFRLVDLVLIKGKTVQPYYVLDEKRPSTGIELERMEEIREQLFSKDSLVRERILPAIEYPASGIPQNKEITESLQALKRRSHIGGQYDFLARLALHYDIRDLELCIHKDDKAHAFLEQHVEKVTDTEGKYTYRLGENAEDKELHVVFNRFLFPIFEMTKLEMDAYAQEHGFKDIMESTWFCHKPLLSKKPCGFCRPCIYTRREGLGRRVPKPTLGAKLEHNYSRAIRKLKSLF